MDDLRAYKLAEIDAYVAACDQLFGPIFDASRIDEFHEWVYPFLRANIENNPFNLYHHPLETVALFFGIAFGTEDGTREMNDLYELYRKAGLSLAWYD